MSDSISKLVIVLIALISMMSACAAISVEDTTQVLRQGTVYITVGILGIGYAGTGWVTEIDGNKVVMTARHVVQHAIELDDNPIVETLGGWNISITSYDGATARSAIVSYKDVEEDDLAHDWCVLVLPEAFDSLPALPISEKEAEFGSEAYWIGFPEVSSVACGVTIVGSEYDEGLYRLSVIGGPGMSGAPIYIPGQGVVGMLVGGIGDAHRGVAINIPAGMDAILAEYEADLASFF